MVSLVRHRKIVGYLRVGGDIIINNHIHRWNIKSSTCNISAYENIALASFELVQGSKPLRL
jgi:hypothetical protein